MPEKSLPTGHEVIGGVLVLCAVISMSGVIIYWTWRFFTDLMSIPTSADFWVTVIGFGVFIVILIVIRAIDPDDRTANYG